MTQTVLLGDIVKVQNGYAFSSKVFTDTGHPVVKIKNIDGARVTLDDPQCIDGETFSKLSDNFKLSSGDVVIAMTGAKVGKLGVIPETIQTPVLNQRVGKLIAHSNSLDAYFAFILLSMPDFQAKILGAAAGSAQPNISSSTLEAIRIPDLYPEQRNTITLTIKTIDEKIELNRRMNETLEQMGQALFRYYFIDNPDAEKWEAGQLDHLFEVTMGQSPPGSSYNDHGEGITFYQGRAEFGVRFPNKRLSTVDPKRLAKKGDTLLSVRAPVGDINQATEDCCVGRGLAAISSKAGQISFCYYLCKNLQARFAEYNSEGTVFGAINGKQLKSLKVKLPAANATGEFEDQASKIDEQIFNNAQQIQTLTTLRDTLLPQLINGKVKV